MSEPVLQISDLQIEFPGLVRNVQVVRGVNLTIDRGKILGLVGESGSGKSMTAMACLGLVPSPGRVRGSVKVDGFEVVGRTEKELAHLRGGSVAMIFQNPMRALNPFFTIGQQMVEILRRHRRLDAAQAREAVIEVLHSVKLPDPELALDKYPHQLSGGQIQRVIIALALACQPKLLIADEPTTALDVTIQAQIIALLGELVDRMNLTVLFITHDLSVVASLCDEVAVMYAGKIFETGTVDDVFNAPKHPYTCKLMDTVLAVGRGATELESIPGQVPDLMFLPSGCAFHDRCDRASNVCARVAPESKIFNNGHAAACHHISNEPVDIGDL